MELWVKPNWHVALVHFPIALLAVGTLWELFSLFGYRRHSARSAGRWMVLAGAVAAVPATFSGIYAYKDLLPDGLSAITDAHFRETMSDHVLLQSVATGVALALVTLWIALSDRWRTRLHWPLAALLLVTMLTTIVGAEHGGKLVYRHRVGVEPTTEATDESTEPTADVAAPAADRWKPAAVARRMAAGAPPLQTHVVLAGLALALAAVTLGLAARNVVQAGDGMTLGEEASVQRIAAAFAPSVPRGQLNDFEPPPPVVEVGRMPPAGRFWLLTALLLIVTAALGWWVLASDFETWNAAELWKDLTSRNDNPTSWLNRRFAHLIVGSALIVLTLLLSIFARFARRRGVPVALLGLLLVGAMAAQVWLGVVLILDGPAGPVTGWSGEKSK